MEQKSSFDARFDEQSRKFNELNIDINEINKPVSYTHLDVCKRQTQCRSRR